jgi:hypothetical protein
MTTGGAASNVVAAGALLTRASGTKFGQKLDYSNDRLGKNDIAILRFLVAIELIESDLWRQYEELGGATDGAQNNYQLELQFLDIDSSKYISRNATDEIEHEKFLNAYLESEDVEPLGFDEFRILQGSTAGAVNIGRLTNLMHLNPDMVLHGTEKSRNSWTNPPQGVHFVDSSTIPRNEADLNDPAQIQAIANMAAFHFGFIELGISSLYASISRKVRRAKILEVTRDRTLPAVDKSGAVCSPKFAIWLQSFTETNQGTKPDAFGLQHRSRWTPQPNRFSHLL